MRRVATAAAIFLFLAIVVGCVAPGEPIHKDGTPNYDLAATLQNSVEAMKEAAKAFMQGAPAGGIDPWSTGGGVLGGLVLAALAAWKQISSMKKKQDAAIEEARVAKKEMEVLTNGQKDEAVS